MAYGLDSGGNKYLDQGNTLDLSEHFVALDPSLQLQPPVAANMASTLRRFDRQWILTDNLALVYCGMALRLRGETWSG